MDSPFRITVYDKDYNRLGWVDAPTSQTWHTRHNQQGNGEIIVPFGSDADRLLTGAGKRVVCHYRDEFLMSGPLRTGRSDGFGPMRLMTHQVQDDFRLLMRLLMWPDPDRDIWDQVSAHDRRTGPIETVMAAYLEAAVERLEEPIDVPASMGRGTPTRYNARMVTPAEDLLARLDQSGIGVRVRQKADNTGLAVEFYEGAQWPITLSEDGGTVLSSTTHHSGPEVTRVVIGGAFDGTAREFYTLENVVLEEQWGDVIEKFVDAGSVSGDYESAYSEYRREWTDLREAHADKADRLEEYRKAVRGANDATKALSRAEAVRDAHPTSPKALSEYSRANSKLTTALNRREAALDDLESHGDDIAAETEEVREAITNLDAAYEQYRDDLLDLGEAELAKGLATTGFSVNLQEGEVFAYGGAEGIHVGDTVPIEITPGEKVTDVVRQASLSLSASGGFTVTPVVGERTDPTTKLMKLIGSAIKGPNRVRTR